MNPDDCGRRRTDGCGSRRATDQKVGGSSRKGASIRTLELDHWYEQLRTGGGAGGRALSGRTVRYCHTVMRQSLEQARKWGLFARNPAVDATPPVARRNEIKPPRIAQVHDLLEAAFEFDPDFGVYLWLLAVTGCRRGEACALRWSDVHWDPAEIALSRSIAQVGWRAFLRAHIRVLVTVHRYGQAHGSPKDVRRGSCGDSGAASGVSARAAARGSGGP